MNEFEKALQKSIGTENYDKVSSVKVGIAGCGGLGSNCTFNLLRSGFKNLVIADFDRIESSNLNRQFFFYDQIGEFKSKALKENLLRINPDAEIESHVIVLDRANVHDIFSGCDIIVEAFDRADMKKMLAEEVVGKASLYVSGSGLSGWDDADSIVTKQIRPDFYLVGDFSTEADSETPPVSPRVNVTAAKQANVVLSTILKSKDD